MSTSRRALDLAKIRDRVREAFPDVYHEEYALAQRDPEYVYDYVKNCCEEAKRLRKLAKAF